MYHAFNCVKAGCKLDEWQLLILQEERVIRWVTRWNCWLENDENQIESCWSNACWLEENVLLGVRVDCVFSIRRCVICGMYQIKELKDSLMCLYGGCLFVRIVLNCGISVCCLIHKPVDLFCVCVVLWYWNQVGLFWVLVVLWYWIKSCWGQQLKKKKNLFNLFHGRICY